MRKHSNELHIINITQLYDSEDEFANIETILDSQSINNRTNSYNESINREDDSNDIDEQDNIHNNVFESIVAKDVIKTINYDNRDLSISFKEYLIFRKITDLAIKIDNICLFMYFQLYILYNDMYYI